MVTDDGRVTAGETGDHAPDAPETGPETDEEAVFAAALKRLYASYLFAIVVTRPPELKATDGTWRRRSEEEVARRVVRERHVPGVIMRTVGLWAIDFDSKADEPELLMLDAGAAAERVREVLAKHVLMHYTSTGGEGSHTLFVGPFAPSQWVRGDQAERRQREARLGDRMRRQLAGARCDLKTDTVLYMPAARLLALIGRICGSEPLPEPLDPRVKLLPGGWEPGWRTATGRPSSTDEGTHNNPSGNLPIAFKRHLQGPHGYRGLNSAVIAVAARTPDACRREVEALSLDYCRACQRTGVWKDWDGCTSHL